MADDHIFPGAHGVRGLGGSERCDPKSPSACHMDRDEFACCLLFLYSIWQQWFEMPPFLVPGPNASWLLLRGGQKKSNVKRPRRVAQGASRWVGDDQHPGPGI